MDQVAEQIESTEVTNADAAERRLGDTLMQDTALVFAVLAVVDELKAIRGEIKRVADNLEGENSQDQKVSVGDCAMYIAQNIGTYVDAQTGQKTITTLQALMSAMAAQEEEKEEA